MISRMILSANFGWCFQELDINPLNPFPDNNILVQIESKLNATQNNNFLLHRVKRLWEKKKMHFLLFPQCFQNDFSSEATKIITKW